MKILVWLARLLVGAVFIFSGVAKMIDPEGFAVKIESYLAVWGWMQTIPSDLVLVGGCALSTFEFVTGALLAAGSLRRGTPFCGALLMAAMLPLTAYIAVVNPVADCGCFGDALILSNWATFFKNLVITALVVFLIKYNRLARPLFAPWVQWMQIAVAVAYVVVLAMVGYNEQPLLDFRPYPVGERLVGDEDPEAVYVYTRQGELREFADSELPDESSGWEFAEVRQVRPASAKQLTLLEPRSSRDVTDSVFNSGSDKMLLLLPHPTEASAAGSFTANELQQAMQQRFGRGSFIAVASADSAAVSRALDVMMADYPVYFADQKAIMAVARGSMPVVYLRGGVVKWKRTLSSVNLDLLGSEADLAEVYATDGSKWFWRFTGIYLVANLLIFILGLLPRLGKLVGKGNRFGRVGGGQVAEEGNVVGVLAQ